MSSSWRSSPTKKQRLPPSHGIVPRHPSLPNSLLKQIHDPDNVKAKVEVVKVQKVLHDAENKTPYHQMYFKQIDCMFPYFQQLRQHLHPSSTTLSNSMRGSSSGTTPFMSLFCPCVFSTETTATGSRKYLLTSYPKFIHHYYRKTQVSARNHYELIPNGLSCRLYFDIECTKKENPDLDYEQIITTIKQEATADIQVCCLPLSTLCLPLINSSVCTV